MKTATPGGMKYFVTFIDDYSRMVFVYFMKEKSKVLSKFKESIEMANTYTERKIKILRTNNGEEYCSSEFNNFCKRKGIIRQLTAPYSIQYTRAEWRCGTDEPDSS